MATPPIIYVLAGPNGAGKSTVASQVLPEFNTTIFVNADEIEKQRQCTAMEAGQQMLAVLHALRESRVSFAFETTLAARSYVPFLKEASAYGYFNHLIYIWLRTPELAKSRVADRVREGGHHIPNETIERRYWRGVKNFNGLYARIVDGWAICDNSQDSLIPVAKNRNEEGLVIQDKSIYREILDAAARSDI